MAGSTDYLLRIVVEDLQAYERLVRGPLHAIPGIASIESEFAFGIVKQTRVFPQPTSPRSHRTD
jgi:DNA-binding Lrp family transcriptional regulator